MKKLLLSLIFLPITSYASNWVLVSTNATGDKFKIETNSITRNGNEVTFWEIINNAKRSETGELSSKSQATINCQTREYSTKFIQLFSDYDAKGTMNSQFKAEGRWNPIPPDTSYETVMKFVCKKK